MCTAGGWPVVCVQPSMHDFSEGFGMGTQATVPPEAATSRVTAQKMTFREGGMPDLRGCEDRPVNEKLYAAIPAAAKVLELGCGTGRLGEQYKKAHPGAQWVGVDVSREALTIAAARLDATYCVDLDETALDGVGSGYDCVVMGNVLEHLKYPERLLEELKAITTPEATLLLGVPNMSHISVLERLIMGDACYDDEGLMDRRHLRFYSCSSLFKMLLDCGWLPHQQDCEQVRTPNMPLTEGLLKLSTELQIPLSTAVRYLVTYQVIARCTKLPELPELEQPVSVIVPVTNEAQLGLNILKSPGLQEINAEVIAVQHAASAAEAYAMGSRGATHAWRLFCHQDVYFPKGSGKAIAAILSGVEEARRRSNVLGFAGLALEEGVPRRAAGLFVDRINGWSFAATERAVSVDELCVAIHRDYQYRIDPELGWHLWATDLCLQALTYPSDPSFTHVARVPLFHNSASDWSLPASYREKRLLAKYPQLQVIMSLCSTFSRSEAGEVVSHATRL
jgi:SAM-dependent methyltransferase